MSLEDTNLTLGDVVADILGKSARSMLQALLQGQTDPAKLADLARGKPKRETGAIGRSVGWDDQAPSLFHAKLPANPH